MSVRQWGGGGLERETSIPNPQLKQWGLGTGNIQKHEGGHVACIINITISEIIANVIIENCSDVL